MKARADVIAVSNLSHYLWEPANRSHITGMDLASKQNLNIAATSSCLNYIYLPVSTAKYYLSKYIIVWNATVQKLPQSNEKLVIGVSFLPHSNIQSSFSQELNI